MKSRSIKLLELMDALPDKKSWRDEAKCAGKDPRDYYVENLNPSVKTMQAKQLCKGCPVIQECSDDAKGTFSLSNVLGLHEVGASLATTGVVRGGAIW